MFDIYAGDIELTTLVLILCAILIIPIQVLLCFKAKSRTVRMLPTIVFATLAVALVLMGATASGWDGLGYIALAILAVLMLLACGIGWGIWAIIASLKKKKIK